MESNIFSILLLSIHIFHSLRRNGRHLVMHVRDPKVQRSSFITSSCYIMNTLSSAFFYLEKHVILGVTNALGQPVRIRTVTVKRDASIRQIK